MVPRQNLVLLLPKTTNWLLSSVGNLLKLSKVQHDQNWTLGHSRNSKRFQRHAMGEKDEGLFRQSESTRDAQEFTSDIIYWWWLLLKEITLISLQYRQQSFGCDLKTWLCPNSMLRKTGGCLTMLELLYQTCWWTYILFQLQLSNRLCIFTWQ